MATTTNYGWTTPDDTALVKDGAAAIRTLGSSIDTSLNTALGTKKAGLVLLNTTSFSAVSSQIVSNVFSANYKSYKIVIEFTQSAANDCYLRMRTGSSTDSGNNYLYNTIRGFSTTLQTSANTSQNHFQVHYYSATGATWAEIIMHNPFESSNTYYTSTWRSNQPALGLVAGIHNLTTSYESFELSMTGGTFTGTVKTYGLNQ